MRRRLWVLVFVLLVAVCLIPLRRTLSDRVATVAQRGRGVYSVSKRVSEYKEAVQQRMGPDFKRAGVNWPPKRIILVGLKQKRLLEVWVTGEHQQFKLLKTYRILGASGELGPKLRRGDQQVPEGLYRVESLNPNSICHLSLRLNYPNEFDRAKGKLDRRSDLGSDIMIHGGSDSIGCLAIGDEGSEDLFVLAAETGVENISVILSPVDFRRRDIPKEMPPVPPWTAELYVSIKAELGKLR